tara:strand:- start:16271 stop:17959 length:1689 start_codon:yes stop_codon:yes gene_type:complete
MLALASLGIDSYPQSHPVAMTPQGVVCWGQFVRDVAATRDSLDDAGSSSWALFEEDSYRMIVGLFALWSAGATVYLPGENHQSIIERLRAEGARFLGLFPGVSGHNEVVVSRGKEPEKALSLCGALVVFTSGSSGNPKLIAKRMQQLDAELGALETQWGDLLGQSTVMATVSHQHFYGLVFSVLWPLCSGRVFWHRPFFDTVLMCHEAAALPRTAWIMSPAHLHRLSQEMPWDEVRNSLSAIYSSGGPLDFEAVQSAHKASGKLPLEVFGSSETGGIAWRQQAQEGQAWQTLPGVQVRCTEGGALAVYSAFLPDDQWYVTADGATVDSLNSFHLGERLDRIVKIEGKRVSLPEVEALLAAHDWIVEAVAIPLKRRRLAVAAALVLSATGEQALADLGKGGLTQRLRVDIATRLSAFAVPRYWRLVTQLPKNTQGKIRYTDIEGLFRPRRIPEIVSQDTTGTSCKLWLRVPASSPYFEGHFPDVPVLPGVVQVVWAEHFGRELLGVSGSFRSMRTVKFKAIVLPGAELELSLEYSPDEGRLQFHYRSGSGEHSQGRLLYEEEI